MELSLHRWPYAGRALRRASVPPWLGGLLTFSLSLMAVGIVVYAGAVPSLAEQSPLVRQWAGADRARALGPDAPLMGVHGLSGTGGGPSGAGDANGPGATSATSDDTASTTDARAHCPTPADLLLLGGRSVSLLGSFRFAAPTSTGAALSADPRTRHTSEGRRRPQAIRILQARTRPAPGSANGGGGASSGNSSGGGSSSRWLIGRQCCCADTERTGARPGADHPR